MARLSQQALSDATQAFLAAGVSDVRNMETLQEALLLVRSRVRETHAGDDLSSQSHGLARAIQPLTLWIMKEPDLVSLDAQSRFDLTWNLYSAGLARTAGAEAFPLITGSEDRWNEAVSQAFGPLSLTPEPLQTPCRGETVRKISACLLLAGLAAFGLDYWVQSGRWRFYLVLSGALLIIAGVLLFYYSPRSQASTPTAGRLQIARPNSEIGPSLPMLGGQNIAEQTELPPGLPPMLAPTLPGNVSFAPTTTPPGLHGVLNVGDYVTITGAGESAPLAGHSGQIKQVSDGKCEIQLSSGLKIGPLHESCFRKTGAGDQANAVTLEAPGATGQFYAPFALGGNDTKVQMQAGRLKTALEKSSALQSTIPTWGQLFWQAVKNEDDLYGLENAVKTVLLGHGYIGAATISPPRVDELKRQLAQLETWGGPPHGSGGSVLRVSEGDRVSDPEQMAWHLRLPADLQRAGPEIYRNIRSEGVSSVRQWVNEQHPSLEQKATPQYQDLFMTATIIDYEVAECKTEGMLMQKLAVSDALEIHLRKL